MVPPLNGVSEFSMRIEGVIDTLFLYMMKSEMYDQISNVNVKSEVAVACVLHYKICVLN